ncbi:MAG TPA: peptidoglycan-binding protein, partial [Gammaproteobacteria bacterium]|nr:peptidoglycan-binding protein [Gammaproteobacteria bacterium]
EPQVRYLPLSAAVTSVNLDGLRPFLSKTRVVTKREMSDAGYILRAADAQPAMGANTEIYARDIKPAEGTRYAIFHLGDAYIDPENHDTLGYEGTYIGEATVQAWGDPQKVYITSVAQEARAGDRFLTEAGNGALDLNFPPHAPAKTISGQIAAVLSGEAQIGQYDVVLLNRGSKDGVDPGTVLGIYRKGQKVSDPNGGFFSGSVTTPIERSGTLMVFRSFDNSSYAVVMIAKREIHVADVVANP